MPKTLPESLRHRCITTDRSIDDRSDQIGVPRCQVEGDDAAHAVADHHRLIHGAIAGPMETWLALRGMRTMHLRVERASANAADLAGRLADHPCVQRVRYPGLGAIVAIEVPGGAEGAERVASATRLWTHATSLGGVESSFERRRRWRTEPATIPDALVRLSVGIEDVDDLWDDLAQALDSL